MHHRIKPNAVLARHLMLRASTTHGACLDSHNAGLFRLTVCPQSGVPGDLAPILVIPEVPVCHRNDCAIELLHGSQHKAHVGCLQGTALLPGEVARRAATFPGWIHNNAMLKHAQ